MTTNIINIADVFTSLSMVVDRVNDERNASEADREALLEKVEVTKKNMAITVESMREHIEAGNKAIQDALTGLQWDITEMFKARDKNLNSIVTPAPPSEARLESDEGQ